MQLRIEQCAAPDEKLQAAAECLPHLAEQHEVEKSHDGCQQAPPAFAFVVAVLIVDIGRAEREVEQPFGETSFGPNRSFDVFAEIFASAGTDSRKLGFTSRIFCGIFLSVSIGVAPICTVATLAPQAIMM